jgi:integrase
MSKDKSILPARQAWQPILPGDLAAAGEAANQAAARHRFDDYRLRRSAETLRRQQADLDLFAAFLLEAGVSAGNLADDPQAWQGVTWGLVEAFIKWELQQGYAIQSINVRLSTLKAYARLAMQAGSLTPQDYAMIRSVSGFSQKEVRRVDQRREVHRRGSKKADPVLLTPEQAEALKHQQPDDPQGRRDTLLMCLLLDHGLRVGEVAALVVEELDLSQGVLRFYRPKVSKEQVHRLTGDTLRAAQNYAQRGDIPLSGPLLRRSLKSGKLTEAGMTERAITQRVNELGKLVGVMTLSAHDCRHYWATSAARHGTDPFDLQQAGGWSSLAMPRRYVEDNEIANEGVILKDVDADSKK